MATQTISNAGPKIRTKLPGPKAQAVLQGDAQIYFAVLHALLSAGGQARPRRD